MQSSEAPDLLAPATVAAADTGVRFQLALDVEDVDSFRDPGGHIWEMAR